MWLLEKGKKLIGNGKELLGKEFWILGNGLLQLGKGLRVVLLCEGLCLQGRKIWGLGSHQKL